MHISFRVAALFTALLVSVTGWSQEATKQQDDPLTASEELAVRLDQLREEIAFEQREIIRLETYIESGEGSTKLVLTARRDKTRVRKFEAILTLAREVATARDSGADVATEVSEVISLLQPLPAHAFDAVERIRAELVFPTNETAPAEFVILDQELLQHVNDLDAIYSVIVDYIAVADLYDMGADEDLAMLQQQLSDAAANRSVFLELAAKEFASMRRASSVLPANSELDERMRATQARVDVAAASLQQVVALMNTLQLDTAAYRRQVLTVTGDITTDVLDVGLVAGLANQWGQAIAELTRVEGPKLLLRLLLAALILFAFVQLGRLAKKLIGRALSPERANLSRLLRDMILSSVKNVIIMLGALIALSQLGISLGPLLAGLGIAGFIIGFALQDSLSNFVSGMMILIYRPFDVGDFVDVAGVQGKVHKMSLVNTTFLTIDNRKLVMPNNMVWQSVITNYTDQATRRVDLIFGIAYGDDINKAEAVIHETLSTFEAILDEPETVVRVHELGDSSVNIVVRPWVRTDDYWETYWGLTKEIKLAFDKAGITIPFPQRDLHILDRA
ncbi:MAG: mechanosensitive ion channel family protein [Woeseiaceae bacterium]